MNQSGRNGFALPLTIFLIAFLTVLLAAAMARVSGDRRIAQAAGNSSDARGIAQSGLQYYMGSRTSRPSDGDSVRINVTGGYATVVARIVQKPADTSANETYVIRSTGYTIDTQLGAEPQAARTVAQFAVWQTASIDVHGAFTAVNGLKKGPNYVYIYGNDQCGVHATTAGIREPHGPNLGGLKGTVYGSPSIDSTGNASDVATETDIDWASTIGGGLTPDYINDVRTYASGASDYNGYTIQLYNGDYTLTNTFGTGLLIVTGDLTFSGSYAYWYGVILVGGKIKFNATSFNWIDGQTISGLNQVTGTPVQQGDIGNQTTYLYYDSCIVRQSLSGVTGFSPISNAWVDNWASY